MSLRAATFACSTGTGNSDQVHGLRSGAQALAA